MWSLLQTAHTVESLRRSLSSQFQQDVDSDTIQAMLRQLVDGGLVELSGQLGFHASCIANTVL